MATQRFVPRTKTEEARQCLKKPYPQGEGPEWHRGLYRRRACGECGDKKASMACCDMHNGAQGCCPARGDAVRRRGGEGRKTWRDATRRPQTNAGGRHGRDEAAGRARAAVARAMAIHDVAVRNAYAVAQAAVATRASRHRDAQRLVAQSICATLLGRRRRGAHPHSPY